MKHIAIFIAALASLAIFIAALASLAACSPMSAPPKPNDAPPSDIAPCPTLDGTPCR